jgi:hypothetical protein
MSKPVPNCNKKCDRLNDPQARALLSHGDSNLVGSARKIQQVGVAGDEVSRRRCARQVQVRLVLWVSREGECVPHVSDDSREAFGRR